MIYSRNYSIIFIPHIADFPSLFHLFCPHTQRKVFLYIPALCIYSISVTSRRAGAVPVPARAAPAPAQLPRRGSAAARPARPLPAPPAPGPARPQQWLPVRASPGRETVDRFIPVEDEVEGLAAAAAHSPVKPAAGPGHSGRSSAAPLPAPAGQRTRSRAASPPRQANTQLESGENVVTGAAVSCAVQKTTAGGCHRWRGDDSPRAALDLTPLLSPGQVSRPANHFSLLICLDILVQGWVSSIYHSGLWWEVSYFKTLRTPSKEMNLFSVAHSRTEYLCCSCRHLSTRALCLSQMVNGAVWQVKYWDLGAIVAIM